MAHKDKEAGRAYKKRWAEANPERRKRASIAWATKDRLANPGKYREKDWRQYGMVGAYWEDFLDRLAQQRFRCALPECDEPVSVSSPWDHNHLTGQPRGVLCSGCNILVGRAEDRRLNNAMKYIANWEG